MPRKGGIAESRNVEEDKKGVIFMMDVTISLDKINPAQLDQVQFSMKVNWTLNVATAIKSCTCVLT